MIKRGFLQAAALSIFITGLLTSCAQTPGEDIINDFISEVNSHTDSNGVTAGLFDNYIVLTLKIKDTPENRAKILIMHNDRDAQDTFRRTIEKTLTEGDVLARIVKERKQLLFQVSAGDFAYYITYTPQQIYEIAFKNK